jgi:hypothetical protein
MTHTFSFLRIFNTMLFLAVIYNLPTMAQGNPVSDGTEDWTIVATYTIPGKASGLAWDGNDLYFGIYGSNGDQVYTFNPETGTYNLLFSNFSINDSYGMTFDGTDLWITDHGLSTSVPAYALQLDFSGTALSQFDLPDHYMSGIAYDNGDFWVCTYYPDPGTIYKVDATGAILEEIPSPEAQPWDICLENENLWVVDYYDTTIIKIDKEGNILETHDAENIKPAGLVYDGEYLWYVDGPNSSPSTLYKVSLSGSGTPLIDVPVTSYDFGTVAVDDSASWFCSISNTGTADLEITNVVVQNAAPVFLYEQFPQTIAPGNTIGLELRYKPTEAGSLNTIAVIESNDPINPEVELTLVGEAVFNGPHISVPVTIHDYGTVRENATTRWFLEVMNNGNDVLELTDIAFDSEQFYPDWSISFPLTVDVLETVSLGIWFHPEAGGLFEGMATLSHNDLTQGPVEVSLSGEGDEAPYPIGEAFWSFTINTSWDNSIKAIAPISDVSDDGVSDVIVCSEDDFVRCFNGNASGMADMLWEHEAGSVYEQVGLATIDDIDGDGYKDVIVGLAWGVRAVKALSGRTGALLWTYDTHVFGDGGWIYQVWTGYDYNADGMTDVLASSGNDGNNTGPKRIFCLDGLDGSVIWDAYTNGPNFSCMGVGDITGDGQPDVIGGASTVDETQGKVYGIDGADGSIEWTYTTAGSSVWAIAQLDDINGDDIKDIIAGDFGGNYYLLDATDGAMLNSGSAGNNIMLRFERLDDVNGNGYSDMAIAYAGTNSIVIDGLDGTNIWLTPLTDKCWNIDRIPDINGDGINDLLAGTLFSSNYCYFLDGTNGEEVLSFNYGEAVDAIAAIPDINGDGSWEMVAGGRNGLLACYSSGPVEVTLTADFEADITTGQVPLTVQFTDLSSGPATSWEWDFENDGEVDATIQHPDHTYNESGQYSVSLTITDGTASNTMVKENYITVINSVSVYEMADEDGFRARPNPFRQGTEIQFELLSAEPAALDISTLEGRLVITLQPDHHTPRKQIYTWNGHYADGHPAGPGIYIATIRIKDRNRTLKLLLH